MSYLIDGPTEEQLDFVQKYLTRARKIIGNKLHSFFIYGAMMFPRPVSWRVDVDFYITVSDNLDENEIKAIKQFHQDLSMHEHLGNELDGYYISSEDAMKKDNPRHLIWTDVIDFAWSLHCAHVHAGKYKLLCGEDPRSYFPKCVWVDCIQGLNNEMNFIINHPEYPQYGVLNLTRILNSYHKQNVVLSKYESAQWALQTIDKKWHTMIESALRDYEGDVEMGDTELLKKKFPEFLKYCESQITSHKSW